MAKFLLMLLVVPLGILAFLALAALVVWFAVRRDGEMYAGVACLSAGTLFAAAAVTAGVLHGSTGLVILWAVLAVLFAVMGYWKIRRRIP